jgi:hypothetical protein
MFKLFLPSRRNIETKLHLHRNRYERIGLFWDFLTSVNYFGVLFSNKKQSAFAAYREIELSVSIDVCESDLDTASGAAPVVNHTAGPFAITHVFQPENALRTKRLFRRSNTSQQTS